MIPGDNQRHTLRIVKDNARLSRTAAEIIAGHIEATLATRPTWSIALSGGSTPGGLFRLMAEDQSLRKRLPWEKLHFFWGDERHVAPADPESNFGLAHALMLSRLPVPWRNIHRIKAENPDAGAAAADYEEELRAHFRLRPGELPRFDCMLQGLGTDGHTASLFPGTDALLIRDRLVAAPWVEHLRAHRISLTLPVLNNARLVLFLVSGEDKAEILRKILAEPPESPALPARLVQPRKGRLIWLATRSAARLLPPSGPASTRDPLKEKSP